MHRISPASTPRNAVRSSAPLLVLASALVLWGLLFLILPTNVFRLLLVLPVAVIVAIVATPWIVDVFRKGWRNAYREYRR